jgi:dienelactone hydrolase
MNMKALVHALFILSLAASHLTAQQPCPEPDLPGTFPAGWTTTTVQRGGRTLNCRLYYPASSAGQNTAVAATTEGFPMIAFGHGFAMQSSFYNSYFEHLASHGYIVIAPQFPDTQHAELALDLLACLEWLRERNSDTQSPLYGVVDTSRAGASGHSMGGGASLLAAASDSRILAVAPMTPAETSPSVIARMGQIHGAVCILASSNDGITPLSTHQQPMYNAAQAFKSIAVLQGGNHTRCMDTPLFDFTDPGGSMTRTVQQQLTRRYMTALFNLFLKDDSCGWSYSYGINSQHPSVTLNMVVRNMKPMGFRLVSPLSGAAPVPAPMLWERTYSLNPSDTIRYTVQTASNLSFSPVRYQQTVTDTSLLLPAQGLDYVTYWRVIAWTHPAQERFSENTGRFDSPIPVNLHSFSAERMAGMIRLRWITELEVANFGFEIQRSFDDDLYTTVGFVPGAGTVSDRTFYIFDDDYSGSAWYRLRQIDIGGSTQIHEPVYVAEEFRTPLTIAMYPNNVSTGQNVALSIAAAEPAVLAISFWSLDGVMHAHVSKQREVRRGSNLLFLRIPDLSPGLYFLHVHGLDEHWTGKLLLH